MIYLILACLIAFLAWFLIYEYKSYLIDKYNVQLFNKLEKQFYNDTKPLRNLKASYIEFYNATHNGDNFIPYERQRVTAEIDKKINEIKKQYLKQYEKGKK